MPTKIYTTRYENKTRVFTQTEAEFLNDVNNQENYVINLFPQAEYQTIEGFGGAITESVGNVLQRMPAHVADEIIKGYFGPQGIGYRFIRSHIDSCDFSLGNYSAVTDENDTEFKTFDLKRDEQNILPFLHKACDAAGHALPVMLTPWSPPAFMKTNGSKNGGGKLKKEYYAQWAKYECRYIKEYRARGINAKMLSVQNEPNATQSWDSCTFTPEEEKEYLRDHLYPTLQAEGLSDVEIFIWDHNKERIFDRTLAMLDKETEHMAAGVSFHWYSGDHFDGLSLVRRFFPGKKLMFSEGCVEYSRFDGENQLRNAQMYAHDMIGNFNGGMNTFMDWNIVLDETGGPNHVGNLCDAPIICDTKSGTVRKNLSYYYIEHFSRYIQPGAVRIATTQYSSEVEVTAAKNKNGELAVVALNKNEHDCGVFFRLHGKVLKVLLPASSLTTLMIDAQTAAF